jgi:hypothetical protein
MRFAAAAAVVTAGLASAPGWGRRGWGRRGRRTGAGQTPGRQPGHPVGKGPNGVAMSPVTGRIYVTSTGGGTVSVIG